MIQLTTFGTPDLRRGGGSVLSVLSQPKRLALLVYLRVAAADGVVPREKLLALFWPESDQERARNSLRQSLHFLRRSLGEEVLTSRTERDVGVAGDVVACDAVAFRSALADGRLEEALDLHRGEFLAGVFVEDAPELERWIEETRTALVREAARAAWQLSERHAAAADPAAAVQWARRALAIGPLDETGGRRLMELLVLAGDRTGALDVFREMERRLAKELETAPSPETLQLVRSIRSPATSAPAAVPPLSRAATGPLPPLEAESLPPAEVYRSLAPTGAGPRTTVAAFAPVRRRRPGRTIGALAAVAVLLAAGWLALNRRAQPLDGDPSVAVLPFLNLSEDPANVYFSDGLAEELLNVLAGVPGLRVAARTSSFAFRDQGVGIDSIARALNVGYVLEGSVRQSGRRVRITAQLIAHNGFHAWSETYDRELDDIFAVQDEISATIARKLQIDLTGNFWGASERETRDIDAYRMLLRALHTFRSGPSRENYATSVTLLEQALQRDPRYARAYGALATVLIWQASFGWIDAATGYARADTLARRSLALHETPEAHLALARLAETQAWSPDSADAHYRRALELNPADIRALQFRAMFLARNGQAGEAVAAARRATELDPVHPGTWSNFAVVLGILGRDEEAVTAFERARVIAPNDVTVLTNLAAHYSNSGRLEEAVATATHALTIDPSNLHLLGLQVHLLFLAGDTALAIARRAALEQRPEFPRYRLAYLFASTQEIEKVLDLLEEAAALREDELTQIRDPGAFAGLRDHPRFSKLLRSLESGGR